MHELKTKLRRRARPASPPRERRECSRRASRAPSRPKRSEQIAGRARAPQTELRRPTPPRWEAHGACASSRPSSVAARAQPRLPTSAVSADVQSESESVSRAVTTQAERADCRPSARAPD